MECIQSLSLSSPRNVMMSLWPSLSVIWHDKPHIGKVSLAGTFNIGRVYCVYVRLISSTLIFCIIDTGHPCTLGIKGQNYEQVSWKCNFSDEHYKKVVVSQDIKS